VIPGTAAPAVLANSREVAAIRRSGWRVVLVVLEVIAALPN
jgi:hypothetical protein